MPWQHTPPLFPKLPLPENVMHAAKRCLVDWFAATVKGGNMPPATLLRAALADELDRGWVHANSGRARIRRTVRTAALINGCATRMLPSSTISIAMRSTTQARP